jgi:demethylspheroidene O-methyltransferase
MLEAHHHRSSATAVPAGWRERWRAWRDSILTSPAFQREAVRWPFTRMVARRRARALFDLVGGFVYSQVLLGCVRVRAFEVLAEGTQPLEALARRFGLPTSAAERLLDAAVALELVEHRGPGLYGLGALGAPLVGNEALTQCSTQTWPIPWPCCAATARRPRWRATGPTPRRMRPAPCPPARSRPTPR